jgi:predicted transcriptional regulator
MTTKEKVLEAVKSLPEDAEIEDAMERLLVIAKIERGIEQADSGQLLSHEEVKQRASKWLNKVNGTGCVRSRSDRGVYRKRFSALRQPVQ